VVPDVIKNSLNQPELKMSPEVNSAVEEMYAFLYEKVYTNPFAKREESKVPDMLKLLFRHYLYNPEILPGYVKGMKEEGLLQRVVDFIAGMTDRYAINKFEELFVPSEWRKEND
jgi:dGTPase